MNERLFPERARNPFITAEEAKFNSLYVDDSREPRDDDSPVK